jgi:uncharacterized protein YndB with AHSA1/START domain
MTSQEPRHTAFVFERICAAPIERVLAAFAEARMPGAWQGY